MAANPEEILDSNKPEDIDPDETKEWVDALHAVIEREGIHRAHFLIESLVDTARRSGVNLPYSAKTAYINTIPPHKELRTPGDPGLEHRIRSLIRWNAMAMVVKANQKSTEYGGHIASFASAATLYDVAFNHFFHGPEYDGGADLVFFQGHSAPGIYARAYMEGRLSEDDLLRFRQGSRAWWTFILSSSMVNARILAISNGIHGARSDHGDLSSPIHEVST